MADYHDIYLQLDVLLLADFFEKFRATCLEYYSLDPVHYYTIPGFAWDAALRMSRVDLQLTTEVDRYHFVENRIRGGVSMISTRHAQADSPSFPDMIPAFATRRNQFVRVGNVPISAHSWISFSPAECDFSSELRRVPRFRGNKIYGNRREPIMKFYWLNLEN